MAADAAARCDIMTKEIELPNLTSSQIAVFEKYARLDISLPDFRRALRGLIFEISFELGNRWMSERYRIPKPGVIVTLEHVQNAITKWRTGQVRERDFVCWACVLSMSDTYEFDLKDQNFIGDSLIDISYREFPPDQDKD
jgi:hypothetical protein